MKKILILTIATFSAYAMNAQPTVTNVAYGIDTLQKLDYYNAPNAGAPILVYVHGGGWERGSKDDSSYQNICQLFNDVGYAVVSINYRLSSQINYPGYPAQPSDLACAIAWTKLNAPTFNGDSAKVVLCGNSAGGNLVTHHGLKRNTSLLSGCNYSASLKVAAIISTSGCYNFDLTNPNNYKNINAMLGDSALYWVSAQPANNVGQPDGTKYLFITGEDDNFVGTQQAINFTDSMHAHNYCAPFWLMPGYDHHTLIRPLTVNDTVYKIMMNFSDSLWQNKLCHSQSGLPYDLQTLKKNLRIYPNPSFGIFNIELDIAPTDKFELIITNIMGQEIYKDGLLPYHGLNKKQIDLSSYPAGIYIIQVMDNKGIITERVVIE